MLIETGDGMRISIIALILFAVISMLVYLYMVQFRMDIQEENMASGVCEELCTYKQGAGCVKVIAFF